MERASGQRFLIASCTLHPDAALMSFDDAFGNGKPNAKPTALKSRFAAGVVFNRFQGEEVVENAALFMQWNPNTRVAYDDIDCIAHFVAAHRYGAAIRRVLNGITDHVLERDVKLLAIGLDDWQLVGIYET